MKSAGISSKTRKTFRQITKTGAFAAQQEGHLAAKERQKFLRMQAAKAQFERQKLETQKPADQKLD
jgi:hypothetical protein